MPSELSADDLGRAIEGAVASKAEVAIDYTNYRGERGVRRILPLRTWFGCTEHHAAPQTLLDATDCARGVDRTFAVSDIHVWDGSPVVRA